MDFSVVASLHFSVVLSRLKISWREFYAHLCTLL